MIRHERFALWALLLLVTRVSLGQTSVVIVVPHTSTLEYEAFEHRLRSELVAEGFQPVSVEVPVEVNPQTLQKNANRLMSPAAISISIRDGSVSGIVWIQARGTNSDSLRSVPDYPLSEQAPAVFAVRATDVLHGGLLELGYIGTTPEAPPVIPDPADATSPVVNATVAPTTPGSSATSARPKPMETKRPALPTSTTPPAAQSKREEAPKAWQLGGMATLGMHFTDFPTSFGVTLSVMRRLHVNWSVGIAGTYFAPIVRETQPYQGRVHITQAFVGPRLECLQPLAKSFTLFEFLESGQHAIFVSSEAEPPNRRQSVYSYAGYSSLGVGANWAINGTVRAMVQSGLLAPWKIADVIVVRTRVAEAAGPAMLFNMGLQLAF